MRSSLSTFLLLAAAFPLSATPQLLDAQFNLPEGFQIYKAAERELTGGSYDLAGVGSG